MDLSRLRNLGVAAHIDAGKTTVTEHFLHVTGVEHRVGQVDEGTTVMDWMPEERERGITITAAATTIPWQGHVLNLIDTPGHVDFTVEVERCMRVLDGAVLVIDAVAGVQAQSETVWRQIRRHGIPVVSFVNKCDRVGADFLAAVQSLRDRLGAPAVPVQYPIEEGGKFVGVVDLLRRQAFHFGPDDEALEVELPAAVAEEVEVLRAELLETLSEESEELMQVLLDEQEPDLEQLHSELRRRTVASTLVPTLCGAALRGIGIPPLLQAILDYLPSPLDRPPLVGFDKEGQELPGRVPDPDAAAAALVFKLHVSAHGDLTFVRIYTGTVRAGQKLWNPRVRRMERVARILRVHGQGGEAVESAGPGEIVALTGLKLSGTGDTLCDRADPLMIEPATFPEPVITLIAEPASSADRDKLRSAIERLAHEDPSFRAREDEDAGQWTIQGMGELHLEVQLHRLEQEFKVEARVGQPRVSYREAVRGAGSGSSTVDRVLGGKEVFGSVSLELASAGDDVPTRVEWAPSCPIPEAFRSAVEEALVSEAQTGPRFGFPLLGCSIRVTGGASREKVDHEGAFAQAAAQALRQALGEAEVEVLEPVMAFEVETPEEFASGLIADLGSRHADVQDVRAEEDVRSIHGRVPLATMFGYSTVIRSLSQGRASFTLRPAGFVAVEEADLEARGLVWT